MKKVTFLKEDYEVGSVRGPGSYRKCPGFQTYYKLGPDTTARRGVLINTIQIGKQDFYGGNTSLLKQGNSLYY